MTDDDPVARALAALRPAAPGVNLPAVLYRAGQASRDRVVAAWRGAFAATAVGLAGTWAAVFAFPERLPIPRERVEPPPATVEEIPADGSNLARIGRAVVGRASREQQRPKSVEEVPVVEAPGSPANDFVEYVRVRDEVLKSGLAGLPPAPPPPDRMSAAEVLRWVSRQW